MGGPLRRWSGPTAAQASVGSISCSMCGVGIPGLRPTDGVVVCADHDTVGCATCIATNHAGCPTEMGLGPRLMRNIEFGYLLDYIQFAAPLKGAVAQWLQDGAGAAQPPADQRHLALQLVALYMAATEDLSH